MTARFIRAVVVSRVVSSAALSRPSLAALCTLSHCLQHGGRFHLSQSFLLTREFMLLEICIVYHQAEQVSQCDWTAVVKGAQHPLIGRLITLSTCLRHGGRFRLTRIIDRLHGSQSKWVVSEMFVLCSGRFVLLARRECHERVDWLASENDLQRDVCVLLGSSGLAHVRVVTRVVSSVRDPVVKR